MNSNTFIPELETETSHDYHSGSRICTRVAGVTFNGRQSVIARLTIGEEILLKREPTNPYDCNAIRVERQNGQQIGYLNRYLAATLAPFFDALSSACDCLYPLLDWQPTPRIFPRRRDHLQCSLIHI